MKVMADKITVRNEDPGSYVLRRSREEKLAVSAQDLLDIAAWIEGNRGRLEREALEELQEQLRRKARIAGKNDPESKRFGGFEVVKHSDSLYLHHPFTGPREVDRYELYETVERWKWSAVGRSWQPF